MEHVFGDGQNHHGSDGALSYLPSCCTRSVPQSKNAVSANIDTSIERQISGQSTFMLKGCMYICLI